MFAFNRSENIRFQGIPATVPSLFLSLQIQPGEATELQLGALACFVHLLSAERWPHAGIAWQPMIRCRFVHDNAVCGAGRQAELASGAFVGDHGVHQFDRPDNTIYRAGLDAKFAANAGIFFNQGQM